MRAGRSLAGAILGAWAVLGACDTSPPPYTGPPRRDCSLVVWHKASSAQAQVEIVASWDGWKRPGTLVPAKREDGWRVTGFDLAPGDYAYAIVEDGQWLLDQQQPTTALHDGKEVSWAEIADCSAPSLRVDATQATADGSASASVAFLAATDGSPLDPSTARTDGVASGETAKVDGDPKTGKIQLSFAALAAGKHVLSVAARDAKGREAKVRLVLWVEARAFDWHDAPIYQVMVDRYRARDGAPLAQPNPSTAFAGGAVEGVRRHLDDVVAMGFRAVWLSPLYANPQGSFPDGAGHSFTGYHGYWPAQSRALDPRFATEEELDRFMTEAHARGVRVLFDVVPHHVHETHPYYAAHPKDWFVWDGGGCSCGAPMCDWATHVQDCWFAPYLPTLDWRKDDVARQATDDVAWWVDRWGGDGVRIDAVPMMPRLAARRIAWALRTRFDHPGVRTLVLGENFTGPGGYELLRYQLGPFGLDSQFHFPLMWALRRSIAEQSAPMSDVDAAVLAGEETWKGSGAVMGLIVGNHDVPRFASVSAGDAGLDPWTPSPQPVDPRVYQKQRMALASVYTLPGVPVVYYGDELGLAGRNDPDSRRVMPAESALSSDMRGVRDFVTRLGKLRDCSGSLRRGTYRTLAATAEHLAFARELGGSATAIVVLTRAIPQPIPNPLPASDWVDALTGRTTTDAMGAYDVSVFLPAGSACVK